MASVTSLPEGFVLDEPATGSTLPPGFELVTEPTSPALAAGVLATAGVMAPAVVAGGKRLIEEVATSPQISRLSSPLLKLLGRGYNGIDALTGLATGRKSATQAATDAARNEILTRAPGALQRLAQVAASHLPEASGVTTGGAMVGAAVPLGLLAAMQHDQQRDTSHVGEGNSLADLIARSLMARK